MGATNGTNGTSGKIHFTPLEKRMLAVLADGNAHTRPELAACIDDELNRTPKHVNMQIVNIRRKIRPVGHDIVCVLVNRQIHYRHVRVLSPEHVIG